MTAHDILQDIAGRLVAAYDAATFVEPITASQPDFSVEEAYAVLAEVEARREAQGWKPVGRKIGFTNRTIWDRYGVWQPMWAHVWAHTVHTAEDGKARLPLAGFVQPRLEPEVVFRLKAPLPSTADAMDVLAAVEWIAPGFEIVQSHFPGWKFRAPDCTALALATLARVLAGQPQMPPLAAGEIVTTGTLTDAWPVAPGETWTSDYGDLGLAGLTLRFD